MNSNTYYDYLGYITTFFSLPTLIIGLLCFKTVKGYLIPLFVYVSVSFITEMINFVLSESGINNMFIFRFYTIIEFILLSFFYSMFFRKYLRSSYLLFLIPVFSIVAFIDYKINGLKAIDNFSSSVSALLLSLYALISFLFVMRKLIFENILSEPFFWINSGVLFYFSGNLLVFAFSNYVKTYQESYYDALWTIPQFLNIFYNILICIGFWKARAR
ncbi:MAG: hypothetical protein V4547_06395 [Bacteroidota bacterium]